MVRVTEFTATLFASAATACYNSRRSSHENCRLPLFPASPMRSGTNATEIYAPKRPAGATPYHAQRKGLVRGCQHRCCGTNSRAGQLERCERQSLHRPASLSSGVLEQADFGKV